MGSVTIVETEHQDTATHASPAIITTRARAEAETTSIEAAGARLGISRSLSYQLARQGQFPVAVIRAGRRLLVSTAALDRLLSGEASYTSAH
jgi:hypothetical protein